MTGQAVENVRIERALLDISVPLSVAWFRILAVEALHVM